MKKTMRHFAVLLTLCLALVLAFSTQPGRADFGDFSSDSDWGSDSSWDSGSDWDSGWDSDWGSSSRSRSSSSDGSSGNPVLSGLFVIAFVGFWFFYFCFNSEISTFQGTSAGIERARALAQGTDPTMGSTTGPTTAKPLTGIERARALARGETYIESEKTQPQVSSGASRVRKGNGWEFALNSMNNCPVSCDSQRLRDLYRRMQAAWGQGDMTRLEADFTPDAFAQYKRQLDEKNARDEHAHCVVQSVSVYQMGWNETASEWRLAVEVQANITAWDTDGEGKLISGSDTALKRMVYAWELRKSKTPGTNVKNCPNCGAPLEMNAGAACPHCETQLTAAANRWALHSIKGISQTTLPRR